MVVKFSGIHIERRKAFSNSYNQEKTFRDFKETLQKLNDYTEKYINDFYK